MEVVLSRSEKDKLYHDLMQPLSAISMLSQVLQIESSRYSLPDEYKLKLHSSLQSIKTSVDNILFILHDYLDMEIPEFRKLSVRDILERIIQQYGMTYGNSERVYELSFDTEDFKLPPEKFVRIINNLLSNATKYCPKGQILVQVIDDGEYHKITVKDSGYGIPKEKLDLVFDRQANEAYQQAGMGIGLGIVQHLVQQLKGTIEVASTIGVGTFFVMKFKK
jgi:signal transduction histidine kinase